MTRRSVLRRLVAAALAASALPLAVPAIGAPITTQWIGASPFNVGFNNPMSAWANQTMWQSTVASVAMREPLGRMGYSSEQLDKMSSDEMIAALRGGKAGAGSPPAPAPVAPPSRPVVPIVSINPSVVPTKTVAGKGELAGLVFPATSATKYQPTRGRLGVRQLVDALTNDPTVRRDLTALVEAGLKEYDREAAADGLVNDVAGSMAYFVGVCSYVVNDGAVPDPEGLALVGGCCNRCSRARRSGAFRRRTSNGSTSSSSGSGRSSSASIRSRPTATMRQRSAR